MDIIKPISNVPAILETRLVEFTVRNALDAQGEPGTPGKYLITVKTVDEQQTSNRQKILNNGVPVRTPNNPIEFDPMLYAHILITRADGTTFFLGEFLQDAIITIDTLKGGLPTLPTVIPGNEVPNTAGPDLPQEETPTE
jgi:hypothetical protein